MVCVTVVWQPGILLTREERAGKAAGQKREKGSQAWWGEEGCWQELADGEMGVGETSGSRSSHETDNASKTQPG